MTQDKVVIVAAQRTSIGSFMGQFSNVSAPQLGASVIKALVQKHAATLTPDMIDDVIMGCVLPAGIGQAPARQATLYAGLPVSVGALTINKVCGSGLKAVMLGTDLLHANSAQIIIAGGMESMSQAPYILPKARQGLRMGHGKVLDHMFVDGLENAYDGNAMGCFAQAKADELEMTRLGMDEFALASLAKAQAAIASGAFKEEITSVIISSKQGEERVSIDESPLNANPNKIPHLKPAFSVDGTITAANSSSISDGAAAVMLMTQSKADDLAITPLAEVVAHASVALTPEAFTIAPIYAIEALLEKTQWQIADVDLFEINEAFAMVTMACVNALKIPLDKVNIHGGACALGHPIGASGARILVTLIHALHLQGKSKGIACLCIGGGEAVAVAIQVI
ncbi:MAG: acetyl-CoA C-acyltransferase [Glaciecola sp.]|nr:acetyl-CoA C-acyltransferase [Glaciecola sp.]